MAYSKDLRIRVVEAYEGGEGTSKELAEIFRLNPKTVLEWVRRYRETGDIPCLPHGGGAKLKLTEQTLAIIKEILVAQNDLTDDELHLILLEQHHIQISPSTVNRAIHQIGFSRKKKTFHDPKKNKESIQKEIAEFAVEQLGIAAEDIVSVDEAGAAANMAREYGRSPIGERAHGERPVRGDRLSMLGALTAKGLETGFVFEGTIDADKFLYFIKTYLVPILRPGHVVLLDNNSFHFADGVEESINAVGASVVYIPRYSPEFNPIEECWSKVKHYLRKAAAWTKAKLYQAISEAFDTITPSDAMAWISHAGY